MVVSMQNLHGAGLGRGRPGAQRRVGAVRWVAGRFALVIGCAIACAAQLEAAEVGVLETGRRDSLMLLMNGPIMGGELTKVRRLVQRHARGRPVTIMLNSPGGKLSEGLRLGTYFFERGIATLVKGGGGSCSSACALAFLGGRDQRSKAAMRIKPTGGKLGFHQFRNESYDPSRIYTKADYNRQVLQAQAVTREIVAYLRRIGEGLDKLKLMLRNPTESMYFVSDQESLEMGIHVLDEAQARLIAAERSPRKRPGS